MDTVDPYAVLTYNGEDKKSKTMDDNENPTFDEEIMFDLNED
jgi:Ca2+-dependent lipid-binding protein